MAISRRHDARHDARREDSMMNVITTTLSSTIYIEKHIYSYINVFIYLLLFVFYTWCSRKAFWKASWKCFHYLSFNHQTHRQTPPTDLHDPAPNLEQLLPASRLDSASFSVPSRGAARQQLREYLEQHPVQPRKM